MRTYEEVWDEYNRLYDGGTRKNRDRLIAVCEEMSQVLAGGYGEGFWERRAELHRKGRGDHAFNDHLA